MTDFTVAFITFGCTFAGAVGATYLRGKLPPDHLSDQSQAVVRLGIGLVATMTALLLGLVTAAARSTFDAQDAAVRNSAAAILTLDRHLARYGPETRPTRDLIRSVVTYRLGTIWHETPSGVAEPPHDEGPPPIEQIENQILGLEPRTDTQRWFKAEALKLNEEVMRMRWQMLGFGGGAVPLPFLAVVIFWLTVTFSSFGLYAPRNATVIAVLFVSAISVAAAVFLVLELDGPFDGVIKVSSQPVRYVLTELGR